MGFHKVLVEPQVIRIITKVGVDVVLLAEMSETIFKDLESDGKQGLAFEDFVDLILDMRGTNPAKVKDVKEQFRLIQCFVRDTTDGLGIKMSLELEAIRRELRSIKGRVRGLHSHMDHSDHE